MTHLVLLLLSARVMGSRTSRKSPFVWSRAVYVAGWTGENCESDIDECDVFEPCENGNCTNTQPGMRATLTHTPYPDLNPDKQRVKYAYTRTHMLASTHTHTHTHTHIHTRSQMHTHSHLTHHTRSHTSTSGHAWPHTRASAICSFRWETSSMEDMRYVR